MKVPGNIYSLEWKFPGTFVPGSGAEVPTGNFRSEERKYRGAKGSDTLLAVCQKSTTAHLCILPVTSADFIRINRPHFTLFNICTSAFYHWPVLSRSPSIHFVVRMLYKQLQCTDILYHSRLFLFCVFIHCAWCVPSSWLLINGCLFVCLFPFWRLYAPTLCIRSLLDGSKHSVSTSCSRSLRRINSKPNTKVIFHCMIILYVSSLLTDMNEWMN